MQRQKQNHTKLLNDIAKFLNKSPDDIKAVAQATNLYAFEEMVMEAQSVINFYEARIAPRKLEKETTREWQIRYNEWHLKVCAECNNDFAYAYGYSNIKYCSLDCLDSALRKIGLKVTRGRELTKRWGKYAPAIVPSSAILALRELYPDSFSNVSGHLESLPPKLHQEGANDSQMNP